MSAILHLDGDNIFFDSADELRFYVMQFGDKKKEYRYTPSSSPNQVHIMYYADCWMVESNKSTYFISPSGRRGRKLKSPATRWYCVTPDGWPSKEFGSVNDARFYACGLITRHRYLQIWMITRGRKSHVGTVEMWNGRPAYHNLVNKRFYRVDATNGKITEI